MMDYLVGIHVFGKVGEGVYIIVGEYIEEEEVKREKPVIETAEDIAKYIQILIDGMEKNKYIMEKSKIDEAISKATIDYLYFKGIFRQILDVINEYYSIDELGHSDYIIEDSNSYLESNYKIKEILKNTDFGV